ncbi:MAG: DUF5687 family protein [Bacteroidales bacterium]
MNQSLFSLAWKESIRSSYWGKSLATTIGLGILALYFSLNFLVLGLAIPKIFDQEFPHVDPVSKFNSFVLGYFFIELIIRLLMQKLPTISFKPFLMTNIRRKSIANYLMFRSLINFFNILPLFLLVPVSVKMVSDSYSPMATAGWFLAVFLLMIANHFLAVYIKWRFNEAEYGFLIMLGILAGLFCINFFGIINLTGAVGHLLDFILMNPVVAILMAILPLLLYRVNFRFLLSRMFINLVSAKQKQETIRDYSWLDKLGETGRFIALELRLIWRNKRPRSVAMMTVLMFGYGLLIYRGEAGKEPPEFIFILGGIMMVGLFSISYGQFFPAWHSNYFSMLMCQRLKMKEFLQAFYSLVTVVSVACYFITLPYAFMYTKIIYTHLVLLLYNLGVNIPIIFFIGLYSKKRLDLEQSSMMNYQGVGASQWLGGLPLLLIPMGLFYLVKTFIDATTGYIVLGSIGLVGIVLHPFIINYFSKEYLKKKHQLISNYKNS